MLISSYKKVLWLQDQKNYRTIFLKLFGSKQGALDFVNLLQSKKTKQKENEKKNKYL